MALVSQDSAKMLSVAQDIIDYADAIEREYADLIRTCREKIGPVQDGNKIWWGPQAELFEKNSVEAKVDDFKAAKANIRALGVNLSEQAQSWNTFENS